MGHADDSPAGVDSRPSCATPAVGRPWHAGVVASEDGFYTRMFASGELWSDEVEETRARLEGLGILGMDMETSTVLTVARRFGARAASLLLATVDASSRQALPATDRDIAERDMITIGLETLAALDADSTDGLPSQPGEGPAGVP